MIRVREERYLPNNPLGFGNRSLQFHGGEFPLPAYLRNLEQGMAADEAIALPGEGDIVGPLGRHHTSGGSRE